jgi:hypothetical protein
MKPVFRCSELGQVLLCPGAPLLRCIAKPPVADTSQALQGRWCHAKAARRLIEEEEAHGDKPELPAYPGGPFEEYIAAHFVDTVRMYVESYMAIEVEGEMSWEFDRFILTGHQDVFAISADGTEIVNGDLKAGSDPVDPADENPQGLGYLVLDVMNYPEARKATCFFDQPQNQPDLGLERVSHIMIEGRDKLEALAHYLERELNHVLDNPHELNSDGWKQCHYCSAALICPAFAGDIEAMKMTLTPEQIAAIPTEPDLERLWFFEQAKRKFGGPLDTAHEALRTLVEKAGTVVELKDGTKLYLVDRAGRRTFANNGAVAAKLDDLPDNLYHRCYAFSGGDIEDALAEYLKLPKTSKKGPSGQTEFRERLKGLYEQAISKVLEAVAP